MTLSRSFFKFLTVVSSSGGTISVLLQGWRRFIRSFSAAKTCFSYFFPIRFASSAGAVCGREAASDSFGASVTGANSCDDDGGGSGGGPGDEEDEDATVEPDNAKERLRESPSKETAFSLWAVAVAVGEPLGFGPLLERGDTGMILKEAD
mmetsp:Transcript_13952/g.30365  ORF Transcript_13952/g.30365 Transcript_13952/m.30365 type:complete len:150 (+) Transcript_13952:742-1191(+)